MPKFSTLRDFALTPRISLKRYRGTDALPLLRNSRQRDRDFPATCSASRALCSGYQSRDEMSQAVTERARTGNQSELEHSLSLLIQEKIITGYSLFHRSGNVVIEGGEEKLEGDFLTALSHTLDEQALDEHGQCNTAPGFSTVGGGLVVPDLIHNGDKLIVVSHCIVMRRLDVCLCLLSAPLKASMIHTHVSRFGGRCATFVPSRNVGELVSWWDDYRQISPLLRRLDDLRFQVCENSPGYSSYAHSRHFPSILAPSKPVTCRNLPSPSGTQI